MKYHLYTLEPKTKEIGEGVLAVGNGEAFLFDDQPGRSVCLATLTRCQIRSAGPFSIILDGFEECGVDRAGRKKFRFQAWNLLYPKDTP